MMLPAIQTNLLNIIQGISALALLKDLVVIDDGNKNELMEAALGDKGLVVVIMPPQGSGLPDRTRGAVKMDYSTTIWVRTNPKILKPDQSGAAWNPLDLESWIILAVLFWSRERDDFGFVLTPGAEPETDWTDIGNNSRLIRFSTAVNFR
jgi:hypothetical protein